MQVTVSVLTISVVFSFQFLMAELNLFYLKFILWISLPHFIMQARMALYLGTGAVSFNETFWYMDDLACVAYKGEGVVEEGKKKNGGAEEGRERLLQKPLLLYFRLLFYGNRINKADSSMTNQNEVRGFLHD